MATALTIAGVGGGLTIAPSQTVLLQQIPRERGGLAASVGQLAQRVGSSLGVAAGLSVLFSVLGSTSATGLGAYRAAFPAAIGALAGLLVLCLAGLGADTLASRSALRHGEAARN